MPASIVYSGETDYERTLMLKLDQVLEIVQDLQVRQREMETRQKAIKEEVDQAPGPSTLYGQ